MITSRVKLLLMIFAFICCKCNTSVSQEGKLGGPCDGCNLIYQGMPSLYKMSWQTRVAVKEPGETLIISGRILKNDGKTPAPNVILYVYHTDARGYYAPADTQKLARRHGHLRGWMKTNSKGEYQFTTIRPSHYPNNTIPEHIHPIIIEPNKTEYFIDEYEFTNDPLLTDEQRRRAENRGGSGIITLRKNDKGIWIGHRDIILGLNIPNYK